jgi:hypothetical protein
MFAFFLLPTAMAIGGAAVSVPIIIHLINRMRFRRIRWAAMEFLLKSQKRNRRRLIIEQLLLLLMRCALVVLAAFLVSRFIGCSGTGLDAQTTTHFVVLDDTLSMTDQWKDQGVAKTSFDEAKRLIKDIAKNAAQAGAAQELKLVLLSDPGNVRFEQRLNDQSLQELTNLLDDLKPSALHVKPQVGAQAAREILGAQKVGQKILHFVSDFRSQDWAGPESDALNTEIDGLTRTGVQVYLVDAADPIRGPGNQVPLHHDNLGIVDLRSETRVAAKGMPVQFTATVMNFGKEKKENVFLSVKKNGVEDMGASMPIPVLQAASLTTHTFQAVFQQEGFNQITATLEKEEVGIEGDNKRFAVIEVRPEVEVLMIDGAKAAGLKPGGDTFYLQTVLTSAKGYKVVPRGPEELEKPLDRYPSIYLLNVPEISDKALKNLEDYVAQGGNIAVFVGEQVRPGFYRDKLYKDGKGLFPVPLADKPTEPLTPDEKLQKLLLDEQQKMFLRGQHPIFADVLPYQTVFRFLVIDRYWPSLRRDKWNNEPGTVEELATLPNEKPLENFRGSGNDLNNRIKKVIDENDQKNEKYLPGLKRHYAIIRDALNGQQLYVLANALEAVLKDEGNPKDPNDAQHPNLKEFWELPEQQQLRTDIDRFREVAQFGDPLVLSKRFGKGHVLAFLTTAGRAWNEWPGGCPASPTYPIVMMMLQKYLTSGGDEVNWTVCAPLRVASGGQDVVQTCGTPVQLDVDASRYQGKMHVYFQPEIADPLAPQAGQPGGAPSKRTGLADKGEVLGVGKGGRVRFTFDEARQPGVYLFDLLPVPPEAGGEVKPEERAYAFNVDTLAEGELKRAGREDLERNVATTAGSDRGKISLYTTKSGFKELTQRQHNTSESPWLFLAFLVILVLEQALAMHLSFHLRGNEAQLPSQVVRPHATAAA